MWELNKHQTFPYFLVRVCFAKMIRISEKIFEQDNTVPNGTVCTAHYNAIPVLPKNYGMPLQTPVDEFDGHKRVQSLKIF